MAFNGRRDGFDTGSSEGGLIQYLEPTEVAKLPSGDVPGKTVGEVAPSKRRKGNYRQVKQAVDSGDAQPSTIVDGVLVDGHTRAAAHLSLRKPMPVRHAPQV